MRLIVSEHIGKTITLPGAFKSDNSPLFFKIKNIIAPYNYAMLIIVDTQDNYYLTSYSDFYDAIEKYTNIEVLHETKFIMNLVDKKPDGIPD